MKIETNLYSKTLYVWHSVSAIFMYGGITPFHSHNTMQLVFDIRNTFKCRIQGTDWKNYKSIIIKENAVHQLNTNGSVQLILYLDAGSETSKSIRFKYLSGCDICSPGLNLFEYVKPGELEQCLIKPNPVLLEQLVHHLLDQLVENKKGKVSDERIKQVIDFIATENSEQITISHLAENFFLSESRLRFLFKRVTGIPLHRYIIWNKIMLAINKIMNGSSVQDAAIDCGFTDSSHFHKLLLKMFGVSPSQFIKNNTKKTVQILNQYPMSMESRVFHNESDVACKVYKI